MGIRKRVLAAAAILLAWGTCTWASLWQPLFPTTAELLRAPLVLWGEVVSVRTDSPGARVSRYSDTLTSCTARIRFRRLPDGDLSGDSLEIPCDSGMAENDYGQELVAGQSYVFFLSRPGNSRQLQGIRRSEFALRTENVPPFAELKVLPIEEALRRIAKANIAATNEVIAARWCDFLGGMYHAEDMQIFAEVADTAPTAGPVRQNATAAAVTAEGWHLQGTAIAVLCEHAEFTTATYERVLGFYRRFGSSKPGPVEHWEPGFSSPQSLASLMYRMERVLRKDAEANQPSAARLREWMESDCGLWLLALEIIREHRRTEMLVDVRELRNRTTNSDWWRFASETAQLLKNPPPDPHQQDVIRQQLIDKYNREHPRPFPSPMRAP